MMYQIQIGNPENPSELANCVSVSEPSPCAPEEVTVRIGAFPINPADLLTLKGIYPREDENNPSLGTEAAGVVEAVGEKVTTLSPGDKVFLLTQNNWSEILNVPASKIVKIGSGFSPAHAAMMKVNPATAYLMLEKFVNLQKGDWILQSAANSAVGRSVIQLAAAKGFKTLNIVRNPNRVDDLYALGADEVIVDDGDITQQLKTSGIYQKARLAFDCVGGNTTDAILQSLQKGSTLVIYGAMSSQPIAFNPGALVFSDIHIRGFWLTQYLKHASNPEIQHMYEQIISYVKSEKLKLPLFEEFHISNLKEALHHANTASGSGKPIIYFDKI
ncbi:MAG: 2-enoyl thioester reductase domain-containing protein [Sneathiellales bacterium]|nr:2-enoyl thioester reductase domain-containing protein [Sneathiellales bacterium]